MSIPTRIFKNIETAVKFAGPLGMHLAIENIGYTYMNSLETIMKYVRRFNSPYLTAYADDETLRETALSDERVLKFVAGKPVKKVVVVKKKLVNIVV